jgi:mannosyltransferase
MNANQVLFRRPNWLFPLALLAFAWALRLADLSGQDIWWDEARNIEVAGRPLARIASSPELDIHPPVYFYGLAVWTRLAGASAFSTRLFSVFFGLLTVVLSYRLARHLIPGRRGLLAGTLALALAALSPFALVEAQETRMYTLSWALLSAATLALWRATRSRSARDAWRTWPLFLALAVASFLTHYGAVIALFPWAIWLLLWAARGPGRLARFRTLAFVGLAALVLCLPIVPIALRQVPGYQNPNLGLPDLSSFVGQLCRAFSMGEVAPGEVWSVGRWLWLIILAGGGFLALREATDRQALTLLAMWLAGGLALYYVALIRQSAFNARYASFVLPALWAMAGWALAGWRRLAKPLPWLLGMILAATVFPSVRADLTNPRYFHADMRGVVEWLEGRATPQDIILVDQRYPFGFYWPRWNSQAYGSPPAEPADRPPAQYLFVDINRVDEQLSRLAGGAETVYWVTWFESDTDPRGSVSALLNTTCAPQGQRDWRGYAVRWWRCDPPNDFRLAREYQPLNLSLTGSMALVEGDWQGRLTAAPAGQTALVTLRWQALAPALHPLKVSLRLKDPSGTTLAQDDRVLLGDRHLRTTEWSPGETALAVYTLQLPSVPGSYNLTLVLYDELTLEPVGVQDGSGETALGLLHVAP